MESNLKKIIMILLLIIIIFIVILLYYYENLNKENENMEINKLDPGSFEIQVDNNIENVDNTNEFFNIRNYLQYYIDYTNDNNYEAIMKVLDKNYAKQKGISIDSLKQENKKYIGNKIICKNIDKQEYSIDVIIYYVDAYITDESYKEFENLNFTLVVDNKKNLFSVIPENLENKNYEYNFNLEKDNENYYNIIIYENFSEGNIIQEYFNFYKELAIKNPDVAYLLLDKEYKKQNFKDSIEEYKKYLDEINIKEIYLSKYTRYIYDDYNEYVGIDKKGLYYIIREIKPMNIVIFLDNYTILTDKFKEEYDKGTEETKVKMNIDKLIKMVNRHDYNTLYKYLSEDFKNKYFSNASTFENFIKNNFFENNNLNFIEFKKYGSNIYTYKIQLTDFYGNDSDAKEMTIIMKLNENYEFEYSFGIE